VREVVLLVDDNPELRLFVKECLEEKYIVHERENGDQGLMAAFEIIPDLVISDIMMPGTEGLHLCETLKKDERTSHIPVILLTARHSSDQMVEGMEKGADAYIKKPFSVQLLKLQIANLLAGRAAMRRKYAQQLVRQPALAQVPAEENSFLKKAIEVIEANMEDKKFGVGMLSIEMAMSQPVLYRKLKALTDMSVNDFIKSIKLRKAAQLLIQRQLTVNEISYMVGYYDRKYFSREFKKQFGMTPSEYALHNAGLQGPQAVK
jgi:YesN/AraC family two-component response regulator